MRRWERGTIFQWISFWHAKYHITSGQVLDKSKRWNLLVFSPPLTWVGLLPKFRMRGLSTLTVKNAALMCCVEHTEACVSNHLFAWQTTYTETACFWRVSLMLYAENMQCDLKQFSAWLCELLAQDVCLCDPPKAPWVMNTFLEERNIALIQTLSIVTLCFQRKTLGSRFKSHLHLSYSDLH